MDLWIRTQDGLSLIKVDNIFLYSSRKGNIVTNISGRGILKLAEYKTNERALEVLDEIRDKFKIICTDITGGEYILAKNLIPIFYDLPKE